MTAITLNRSIDTWRQMSPRAVCAGSEAQKLFCIEDARNDILALAAEIRRLELELAAASSTTTA